MNVCLSLCLSLSLCPSLSPLSVPYSHTSTRLRNRQGKPAVPGKDIPLKVLVDMVSKIQKVKGISRVVYDLTSKPPGTTEWE